MCVCVCVCLGALVGMYMLVYLTACVCNFVCVCDYNMERDNERETCSKKVSSFYVRQRWKKICKTVRIKKKDKLFNLSYNLPSCICEKPILIKCF